MNTPQRGSGGDVVLVRRSGRALLDAGGGSGSLWIRAPHADSVANFVYNVHTRRVAAAYGSLLDGEHEVTWQRMLIDDDQWYLPIQQSQGPEPMPDMGLESQDEWIKVEGTGFASSPLSVAYWLSGTIGAVEQAASDGHPKARRFVATVSLKRALAEAGALDRAAVAAGIDQLQVQTDLVIVKVEVDLLGCLSCAEYELDDRTFRSVTEFCNSGVPAEIPVPADAQSMNLADIFARLQDWHERRDERN
jgi:hypothetical protein